MTANPEAITLSPLRLDVEILPGPAQDDGSPTALLHDRLNDTFDRVEWREREIVQRLSRPIRIDELEARLRRETTVNVTREEILSFAAQLFQRGLVQASRFKPVGDLLRDEKMARSHPIHWLVGHYLFFKIPLLKPDTLLRRTLWLPRFFGSGFMTVVYAVVLLAAVALWIPRFELFLRSATPFLAWKGAVYLTLAMVCVKICHEFSHAYTAAIRGARVRSMGLAFMVMVPIPYADVTDAWRLPRRARIAISAAGLRTELILASLAALFWCLLPPGPLQDVCLMVASASILSALLTNLNPGMRFDGYYLLSDLIGVDNLQQRAFTQARHWFRQIFLGLDDGGDTETAMRTGKKAVLVAWSVYAVVYRLGLYFGIALIVYHYFPKAIGIVLFGVEIVVFILRPVVREIRDVSRLIWRKGMTVRIWIIAAIAVGIAAWLIVPLPRSLGIEAIVTATGESVVYAPESGKIVANALRRGDTVRAGEVLLALANPDIESALRETELALREADLQLERALSGGGDRIRIREYLAEQSRLSSQLAGLRAILGKMQVRAEADSLILEANDSLEPGVWVSRRTRVARLLAETSTLRMVAYLPDDEANSVKNGDTAWFSSEADPERRIPAIVTQVDTQAAHRIEEPALAGPHGGGMAVMPGANELIPASPVYRMEARFATDDRLDLRLGQLGMLRLETPPQSRAKEFILWLYGVVIRESGM